MEPTNHVEFFLKGWHSGASYMRRRAAQLAWDMQTRQFGGGTAIGNAIEGIGVSDIPLVGKVFLLLTEEEFETKVREIVQKIFSQRPGSGPGELLNLSGKTEAMPCKS